MLSDELANVKSKFKVVNADIQYTVCSFCKHPETKFCLKCEDCGRKFTKGVLMKEANK